VRRASDINVGPDLGGTAHQSMNFTGSSGAAGDTWITVYDQTPGDGTATENTYGSIILNADVLIHAFNNKKGAGVTALFNEGLNQKGLALVVYDGGNTDSLALGTISQANGTFTQLAAVPLGANIGENVWYRLTLNVVVSGGAVTVTGTVFRHATPTDPNSAVTTQVGVTLNFAGSLGVGTLAGVSSPGEVGMVAASNAAVVDSSVTNFVIDP
jgi:hypothetical protein